MPNVFEDLKAGRDRLNAYHESYQRWRGKDARSRPEKSQAEEPPRRFSDFRNEAGPLRGGAAESGHESIWSGIRNKYTHESQAAHSGAGPNYSSSRYSYAHGAGSPPSQPSQPPPQPQRRRPLADPQSFPPPPIAGNARPTPEQVEASRQSNKAVSPGLPARHPYSH